MNGNKISLVYFYLISAVAIGLLIVGTFYWGNLVINLTQFDKYPLRYGLENCDTYPYKFRESYAMPIDPTQRVATPSAEELENQRFQCVEQAEFDRKQHKLDDIKNAVIFTLLGVVLFGIHFPLARKNSK